MRHAIAVLLVGCGVGCGGCGAPGATSSIEITPGPVATVTQGNLLQLAASAPEAHAFELVIDDAVASLFAVHDVANVTGGAIVTLVPACSAASNGTVSMTLQATDADARATLSIRIVSEPNGVCAGAPEHAITQATLQVSGVPDSAELLCTRTSALEHGLDPARAVLRTTASVPNHAAARDGKMICGAPSITMDVWPPIDAPPAETIAVETFSCRIDGCETPANECCTTHDDRLTPLTSTQFAVPVKSMSESIDAVDGESIACADLDGNGTPELILAGQHATLTTEFGGDNRFVQQQAALHASGLVAFAWQAGPAAIENVVLGGFGSEVMRAKVNAGAIAWTIEPQFSYTTDGRPDRVVPVPSTPGGGVRYVARLGAAIELTCISPTCTPGTTAIPYGFDTGSFAPATLGFADVDGDGDEDLVVAAFAIPSNVNGTNPVRFEAYRMTWGATPSASPVVLTAAPTVVLPHLPSQILSVHEGTTCDRIYVLSGTHEIFELTSAGCSAVPGYDAHQIPTPNDVYSIAAVNQRLVAATSLGMFELTHASATGTQVRQIDPLLQEQLVTTGGALIDPDASNYGQRFVTCVAAASSVAFQVKRGGFVWATLDATVEGFTAP